MEKFPKIVQFRQFIRSEKLKAQYVGKDEDGRPIYDSSKTLPILKLEGRTKLHGTNASLVFDLNSKDWQAQSRERVLSETQDNAGFFKYAESVQLEVFNSLPFSSEIFDKMAIYGEWCGSGIQKGVGISNLEKMFVVFAVKGLWEDKWQWLDPSLIKEHEHLRFFNICNSPKFEILLDLNVPEETTNKLIEITEDVERQCLFAKRFGVKNGVGEGVVWTSNFNFDNSFKVKGEKYSKTKVKKLPTVDIEKVNSIKEFIDRHVTEERLNQAFDYISEGSEVEDLSKMGDFIRWMNNDIWEEEGDEAVENEIARSEFGKALSPKCVSWFKNKIF